jgi:hypothetical protein
VAKGKKNKTSYDYIHLTDKSGLRILFSSPEELESFFSGYRLDSAKTTKVMDSMRAKIKKCAVASIVASMEPEIAGYEKKYGVPISDFELSISRMHFRYNKSFYNFEIVATRMAKGVHIIYSDDERDLSYLELELGIGAWLDLMHGLNRCKANEWKGEYINKDKNLRRSFAWNLEIYFLNDKMFFTSTGFLDYPPNWDEFMNVINDFRAKIIEKVEAR